MQTNKTISSLPKGPVHKLLVAFVLLAIATILFFCSKPISIEKQHTETSECAGSLSTPLMCI